MHKVYIKGDLNKCSGGKAPIKERVYNKLEHESQEALYLVLKSTKTRGLATYHDMFIVIIFKSLCLRIKTVNLPTILKKNYCY